MGEQGNVCYGATKVFRNPSSGLVLGFDQGESHGDRASAIISPIRQHLGYRSQWGVALTFEGNIFMQISSFNSCKKMQLTISIFYFKIKTSIVLRNIINYIVL